MKIQCPKCTTEIEIPALSVISGGAPIVLPDHPEPESSGLLDCKAVQAVPPVALPLVFSIQRRCRLSGATMRLISRAERASSTRTPKEAE